MPETPAQPQQRHLFKPMHGGRMCWDCDKRESDPIHLSDDVVNDRFVPLEPVPAGEQKRRYWHTKPVHPETVTVWFLALVYYWFEDENNVFYGRRPEAKEFLNRWWTGNGSMPQAQTDIEIYVAMKFQEWLDHSWTARTPAAGKQEDSVSNLLPCACRSGNESLSVRPHLEHGDFGCKTRGYYVDCSNCWARGPAAGKEEDAVRYWNEHRTPLNPQPRKEKDGNRN